MVNPAEYTAKSETLKQFSGDIARYSLPQLPDDESAEIYERIGDHEVAIATPDGTVEGYRLGSAAVADEILAVSAGRALLTAEHATDHFDKEGNRKDADWGTAGLGMVLHEDTNASLLVARGRQTGNANSDPEHVLKEQMRTFIVDERPLIVAGLHGMTRGKFADLTDETAFDVLLGVGNNPSEASLEAADRLKDYGKDLGLRVGVNQPFVMFRNGAPVRSEDGGVKMNNFKAAGANTTRAFAQQVSEDSGLDPVLMQMELSSLLRFQPRGHELDPRSRVMGVYLGYLMSKRMIELSAAQ